MTTESKKIMVCDDNQGIFDILEMLLESEGFEVITEINSTNLVKELQQKAPDLLLLDLWMPVLSGDQILKILRTSSQFKTLPVIVFSASVDGNAIAESAGATAFVPKPFDIDDVVSKIRILLN